MLKPLMTLPLLLSVALAAPITHLTDPVNAAQINRVVSGVNTNAQLLEIHSKKLDSLITLLSAAREAIETLKNENAALKAELAQLKREAEAARGALATEGKASLEALAADLNHKLTSVATESVRKDLFLEHQGGQLEAKQAELAQRLEAKVDEKGAALEQRLGEILKRFDGGVKQALGNAEGNLSRLQGDVSNLKRASGQLNDAVGQQAKQLDALVKLNADAEAKAAEFRAVVEREGEALIKQVKRLASLPEAVEAFGAKLVEVDVSAKQRHEELMGEVERVDGAAQKRGEKINALEVQIQ
ncbi:hypothetical protein KKF91_19425, partial [Myxococcota bacterium]|nr:hypothetical protein [Myxococcota bacterium]